MVERDSIIAALRDVFDPELQIDVWTLGLIYGIQDDHGAVSIRMTLTTPFCPYGPALVGDVEDKVGRVDGVRSVSIDLVFEPMWQPSEELRAMLGI